MSFHNLFKRIFYFLCVNIGILGYGEVGKGIACFYPNPKIKDITRDDGLIGVDILHVCIPFSEKFIEIVKKEIGEINPKLTIIHSTVAPHTTKAIGGAVVHSPVRGVHPNLHEGIKTFVKYIGADNEDAGKLAKEHFEGLGIKTKAFENSLTTELGKLLDTTYYGVAIAWHGEMKKICEKEGVDFDKVVTDFNNTYNEGYTELGMSNVVRPVLYPPEGEIGGHCVVPNVEILKKYYKSLGFDLILEYGKKE